jgi:hypothetical protein
VVLQEDGRLKQPRISDPNAGGSTHKLHLRVRHTENGIRRKVGRRCTRILVLVRARSTCRPRRQA